MLQNKDDFPNWFQKQLLGKCPWKANLIQLNNVACFFSAERVQIFLCGTDVKDKYLKEWLI